MGDHCLVFKEDILGVEKISTEYRRDPQCGGTFLRCKEEILSVGEISTV